MLALGGTGSDQRRATREIVAAVTSTTPSDQPTSTPLADHPGPVRTAVVSPSEGSAWTKTAFGSLTRLPRRLLSPLTLVSAGEIGKPRHRGDQPVHVRLVDVRREPSADGSGGT